MDFAFTLIQAVVALALLGVIFSAPLAGIPLAMALGGAYLGYELGGGVLLTLAGLVVGCVVGVALSAIGAALFSRRPETREEMIARAKREARELAGH